MDIGYTAFQRTDIWDFKPLKYGCGLCVDMKEDILHMVRGCGEKALINYQQRPLYFISNKV